MMLSEKQIPMRHCFNCGEELGRYADFDRMDHCGHPACSREARTCAAEEREDAHRDLDDRMGWG